MITNPTNPDTKTAENNQDQKERLSQLYEVAIKTSKSLEPGKALRAIKEEELYKLEYESWTAYCENSLDLTIQRVQQLIAAATHADWLRVEKKFEDGTIPDTERSLRLLISLGKEKSPEVLSAAIKEAKGRRPSFKQLLNASNEAAAQPPAVKGFKKKIKVVEVVQLMMSTLDEAPTTQYSVESLKKLKRLAKALADKITALESDDEEPNIEGAPTIDNALESEDSVTE